MNVLVNISNHPSAKWSDAQKSVFDKIIDIPFPNVDPKATTTQIHELAEEYATKFYRSISIEDCCFINLVGEFSFCYILRSKLDNFYGFQFVVATTERQVVETVVDGITKKDVTFSFVQWRRC